MTGDVADVLARLRSLLPPWWPNQGSAPVLDAELTGIATLYSYAYALIVYARAQSRILTASGGWLDLIAWDYFGARVSRFHGESDAPFNARIIKELVRPRVTRAAIATALEELTGYPPRILEGWLPSDVGAIDRIFIDVDRPPGNPARIGDPGLADQIFIETVLPGVQTFGNNTMPAFDVNLYIDQPPTGYIMDVPTTTRLGPQVVYDLINAIRATGVTVWLRFIPVPTLITWDQPGVTWDQPGAAWDQPTQPE